MRIASSFIYMNDVRLRAFHGVDPQEQVVGGTFIVNLRLKVAVDKAVENDNIDDTVNYAEIFSLMKEEIMIPSKLIENVAGRIAKRIIGTFPQVEMVDISVTKQNPPLGADCCGVGVQLCFINEKTI
jgi:7,8-dihydroneopterin aldolase/epimerase/oxygenase